MKYISCKYALNIHPDTMDTFGDWHDCVWEGINVFPNNMINLAGKDTDLNTIFIWNDLGIYEGKKYLLNKGINTDLENVFIADHVRAILDMLYKYLIKFGIIFEIDNASIEYIGSKDKQLIMLEKSKLILPYLNGSQVKEYENWYKSEVSVQL
jgi:hypothetical protein